MNKKGLKSRFDFVNIDLKNNQNVDEIKRVKNIIQRFLITFQWWKCNKNDRFSLVNSLFWFDKEKKNVLMNENNLTNEMK